MSEPAAIAERMGHVVRLEHDGACDGWILHEFVTLRVHPEGEPPRRSDAVPTYKPCSTCRPGAHARWQERLLRPPWQLSPKDRERARALEAIAEARAADAAEPERQPRRDRTGELIEG